MATALMAKGHLFRGLYIENAQFHAIHAVFGAQWQFSEEWAQILGANQRKNADNAA